MIRSFAHRGLKRLYERGDTTGIRPDMLSKVERILSVLDQAPGPWGLNHPSFRLHPLKGNYAGLWAVTVTANWRVVFRFADGEAYDVDLVDYH